MYERKMSFTVGLDKKYGERVLERAERRGTAASRVLRDLVVKGFKYEALMREQRKAQEEAS